MNVDAELLRQQQPTWRLWGEEKTEDAIYVIYLKKVRYHRPSKSVQVDPDDGISHLEWETVRVKFMKAGTLEKLVESLTSDDGELESTYINIFFATYRTFATPEKVLSLILERYEKLVNNELDLSEMVTEQLKKSVVTAIRVWLDSYPDDFRDPPLHTALRQLIIFAQQYLPESDLLLKAKHKLQRLTNEIVFDGCSLFPVDTSLPFSTNGHQTITYSFPNVPQKLFAEQLTRIDVDLFKKVVPHQCLGAVWSRRDKFRSTEASTVLATVNQFNAVSFRVISTILMDPDMKVAERAKIISTWIDVAQELRLLKNFSSLKAIISALQSNPVYRLHKTWQMVAKEKVEIFQELARIFSEENNQWNLRDLMITEGTAKFAATAGENDKHMTKILQRQLLSGGHISHGTIPYLGTYLTDLTMIDTAIPDYTDGLINFDKKRREFEVLAQIKLLQGAANAYRIEENIAFARWFDSILILHDSEAYRLSCQIEPDNLPYNSINSPNNTSSGTTNGSAVIAGKTRKSELGHKKTDSFTSLSSGSSFQFICDADSEQSSPPNSLDRKQSLSPISTSSSPSLTDGSLSSNANTSTPHFSSTSPARSSCTSAEHYIIRVTIETDVTETDGYVLYKSIMLNNNDKTKTVIRNAMIKLGVQGNPEDYTLSQIFSHREFVLPHEANMYYAVNPKHDLNFILRKKPSYSKEEPHSNLLSKCTIRKHLLPM